MRFTCSIAVAVILSLFQLVAAPPAHAALSVLHAFAGPDGSSPEALTIASDGSIYGATMTGGAYPACDSGGYTGCGTVFRIPPGRPFRTVGSFDISNGGFPRVSVTENSGAFFGVTANGGAATSCLRNCGAIYRLAGGSIRTLQSFDGISAAMPLTPLLSVGPKSFYGATYNGGAGAGCSSGGCGAIFSLTLPGKLKILANFSLPGGGGPIGPLALDSAGVLYGATAYGGFTGSTRCGSVGCGTVFRLAPGEAPAVLHAFRGSDGVGPRGLTAGPDGNFYGITTAGGRGNNGTVFRIAPDGTFATLAQFDGGNGSVAIGRVAVAADGTVYGATYYGGPFALGGGRGVIFRVSGDSGAVPLEYFNFARGSGPQDLVMDANGVLYGVTAAGGPNGYGVVFSLDPKSPDPDAFDFETRSGATGNQYYLSPGLALGGFGVPTPISIASGEYRVKSLDSVWSAWTTGPGTLLPSQAVQVRVRALPSSMAKSTAILTVGAVKGSFTVVTQ